MSRRGKLACSLFVLLGALFAGCMNDFDKYEPNGSTFGSSSSSGSSGQGGAGGGPTGCTTTGDCNDLLPCTVDTCDAATGTCSHAPAADGQVPGSTDGLNDCFDLLCQAGTEVQVADDTETPPDDNNPCTIESCSGGKAVTAFAAANTDCGNNLVCNDMGVCVGCNQDNQCPAAPECKTRNCNMGNCENLNKPAGDGCSNGNVCDGNGGCVECVDNGDCDQGAGQVCDTQNNACILSCNDAIKSGHETDINCGGAECPDCADGMACMVNGDCTSGYCKANVCTMPTCMDAVKNGMETDVDCGGPTCPGCAAGDDCMANTDCMSMICDANKCVTCMDTMQNGNETDVDCGGADCSPCANGKKCDVNGDCTSLTCISNLCYQAQCGDGNKNGNETDVDCGGGSCPKCVNGKTCTGNADCISNKCSGNPKTCSP